MRLPGIGKTLRIKSHSSALARLGEPRSGLGLVRAGQRVQAFVLRQPHDVIHPTTIAPAQEFEAAKPGTESNADITTACEWKVSTT